MAERPVSTLGMIGLDAAELSFMQRHLASLPRIRELLEVGRLHRLQTTAGDLPGSVWPTFYTGTLAGVHGIYHHLQWDPEAMGLRRVTENWLYAEPFWNDLERRGLRVATVDVPMTFPSRLRRGIEVINWGSHDQLGPFRTEPQSLRAEIRRRFGSHPMGPEIPVRKSPAQLEAIRRNLVDGARRKGELTRWLLERGPWDFFLTVFGETHRGGHLLWPESESEGEDALLDVYRAVDHAVGEVFDVLRQRFTTVMIFALHGMGRNTSQEHFMPKIMDRVNRLFIAGHRRAGTSTQGAGQRGLVRLLRERVPAGVQNAIARAVPVGVRDAVVSRQITGGHDWGQTPGLALLADLNGYLRWNLRARERLGMLVRQGAQHLQYVEELVRRLRDLRLDGGDRLVSDIRFPEDDYPGPRSDHLPDAIVCWSGHPPVSRVRSEGLGELRGEVTTGRGGNHRFEGFCIVVEGGAAGAATDTELRHIQDLAQAVARSFAS